MSSIKERAKMFSNNPGKEKDLQKGLLSKQEEKVENEKAEELPASSGWSKKKIFIVVGRNCFIHCGSSCNNNYYYCSYK